MRANFEIGCKDTTNPQGCCGLTLVIVGQSPTKSEKVGRGGNYGQTGRTDRPSYLSLYISSTLRE